MLLVVLIFMHVKYSPRLTKLVVVAGFFWLAIMIALTLSDIFTRGWTDTAHPWSVLLPFVHSSSGAKAPFHCKVLSELKLRPPKGLRPYL